VSHPTDAAAPAVTERAATAVYLYGVTRKAPSPVSAQVAGMHGPVRAVEGDELVALVSETLGNQ